MSAKYDTGDVVQFTENHKWCASLGIIDEIKQCENDFRYMIGVPIPERGIAYIFSMESNEEFEFVGKSHFIIGGAEE